MYNNSEHLPQKPKLGFKNFRLWVIGLSLPFVFTGADYRSLTVKPQVPNLPLQNISLEKIYNIQSISEQHLFYEMIGEISDKASSEIIDEDKQNEIATKLFKAEKKKIVEELKSYITLFSHPELKEKLNALIQFVDTLSIDIYAKNVELDFNIIPNPQRYLSKIYKTNSEIAVEISKALNTTNKKSLLVEINTVDKDSFDLSRYKRPELCKLLEEKNINIGDTMFPSVINIIAPSFEKQAKLELKNSSLLKLQGVQKADLVAIDAINGVAYLIFTISKDGVGKNSTLNPD